MSRLRAMLSLIGILAALGGRAQAPAAPGVTSPQITADGAVTLRLLAPNATQVRLVSGGDIPVVPRGGLDLIRGEEGVWALTLPQQPSGAYRYRYAVDGVMTLDPSHRATSESNGNAWSLYYVPGAAFMDVQRVPHDAVAAVPYYSSSLGHERRMHVYTPPGYERGGGRYPVLYLLHGAADSDDSWSRVGRAGFILDNLIAAGRAKPMLVVMPDGHTEPFVPNGAGGLQIGDFVREFAADIKPLVESRYRVALERRSTAIAGLSMGGVQTLEIAMASLGEFGYIGVFSSGVFGIVQSSDWENRMREQLDDAGAKRGLDLMWFATGKDDFLLETTKATVAMFEKRGFAVEYHETSGGHTWINWREYLASFTPRLFR